MEGSCGNCLMPPTSPRPYRLVTLDTSGHSLTLTGLWSGSPRVTLRPAPRHLVNQLSK
jgi:hypothetical protein